jgi:hypothetical protein
VAASHSARSGHRGGEHGLALPVGIMQGLVAVREFLLPGGGVVLAAAVGGFGFRAGAKAGQVGVPGGGADLAQLVTHALAAQIPAARFGGTVEVRPMMER